MELLFAQRLRQYRRLRDLTQEQLAQEISISPQSVSKWERGDGYPDITLLPDIANYFKITVDELIGNDEATRIKDVAAFRDKYCAFATDEDGCAKKLALTKEYYEKYPADFDVIELLEDAVVLNMDKIGENIALLKELHGKIINGSTVERLRRESIERMFYVCPDDELEELISKGIGWGDTVGVDFMREERFRLQNRFEDFRAQRCCNDLQVFMQYIGRGNDQYYGSKPKTAFTFDDPARTAAWELHKLRLLEAFSPEGLPEAWYGCYAEFSLKAASALIALGRLDEGFSRLSDTFPLYERWLRIPKGALMDAGCPEAFGGAKISKWDGENNNYSCYIHLPDGKKVWTPFLWLFWQLKNDIFVAMTQWKWYDDVRDDARYAELLERAKLLAETQT